MQLGRVCRLNRCFHTSTSVKALSPPAQPLAERISANWKGTSATGSSTKNFIGGEFVESRATEWIDVHDPVSHRMNSSSFPSPPRIFFQSTQTLLTRVPQTTDLEFNEAVDAASEAFKTWGRTSAVTRQRFILEYVHS